MEVNVEYYSVEGEKVHEIKHRYPTLGATMSALTQLYLDNRKNGDVTILVKIQPKSGN